MDQTLTITESGAEGGASRTFHLKGPLLISNLFDFQSKVRSCQAQNLVLDLTGVPYMDSAGVGVIIGAYVTRERDKRGLLLVGVNDRVRALLHVTQVERLFQFADKLPESA